MISQLPQPYFPNNANQLRLNHHLNYAPQQPQQPTFQTQQYNFLQKEQQQYYQSFSNVQQPIKNQPQLQYPQQQQSNYSYQQSGGQYDYKFPQPQIGNNVVALPPKQSYQAPNSVQWARNAGQTGRFSSFNNEPEQNFHFQVEPQISNLNPSSIRQNWQQPLQQQQQQLKPPINPYYNENKQLTPLLQRGRANEAQPANSQNSVIKPDEELFKCSAKNCTNSFIKKKSDTMTTMCSDCKKQIMIRYTSPEVTLRCSTCSQPVINTYLTGELCQECWRKKNEESQNKSTRFQKVMFSSKRPLGKEDPQKTKDLSSSASQSSNQLGSSNKVVTPKSNWKDAQSSLALEKQTKEQEKEQTQQQEEVKIIKMAVTFQSRDQQKQQEGKGQNQNQIVMQQAQIITKQSLQQFSEQQQQLDILKQYQKQQQIKQNVNTSGSGEQSFSQPGGLVQQRAQENSQQMNNPQGANCLNQISSSNQLNNQNQLTFNKQEFKQILQANKLQPAQQTSDNKQPQSSPISSANALDRSLHNQVKDQQQQPSVSSFGNGLYNNMNIMNKEPQIRATQQSNQIQSTNKGTFGWKAPQQASETNNANVKPSFEQNDRQQLAFSLVNNQFQSTQIQNSVRGIGNFQTPNNNLELNKPPFTQNPQKYPPSNTQNPPNIKEQPSFNMRLYPSATINLQQKRENWNPSMPSETRQNKNLQPDNQNGSLSKVAAPSGSSIRSGSRRPACAICQSSMPSYYKEQLWYCQCHSNQKKIENPFYGQKN